MGKFEHTCCDKTLLMKLPAGFVPYTTSDKLFQDFPKESVKLPPESPRETAGRKTSTTKILAILALLLSSITFTAFVVSFRWTLPGRNKVTVLDDEPRLPEGYVESVLARVFGNHTANNPVPETESLEPGRQKRGTSKLNKRALPLNQLCGPNHADDWLGRICDPGRGVKAWVDVCYVGANQPDLHVQSECVGDTYCSEIRDADGDDQILCLPNKQDKEDNLEPDPKRRRTTQYGFRTVDASASTSNTQILESVTLLVAMTAASVSGRFVDQSKSYVIAPNNEMNANERGFTLKLCRSAAPADYGGRDCRPKQKWYFTKGDIVDYSFGAAIKQKGVFFYAINGSV